MISSTLMINSAASEAEFKDCYLLLKHSYMPNVFMLPTVPFSISNPDNKFPSDISTFNAYTRSGAS